MLKDFVRVATSGNGDGVRLVNGLRRDVRTFARQWPLPGADISTIQRPAGIEEDD